MAANLIRAHRAELLQATRGKLDHLVIEVVSSLFDQILSDARVPPQMARQIARLQLPVLRAALTDGTFFSSRRHPVRRFINRVASLAVRVRQLRNGPAKELLERVAAWSTRSSTATSTSSTSTTPSCSSSSASSPTRRTPRSAKRGGRDAARQGARVARPAALQPQLRAALEPLALPAFLRDFLAGVWARRSSWRRAATAPTPPYPVRLREPAPTW